MDRIYLYVPFEEEDEVKALGARLDDRTKCWYIEADQDREKFRLWLGEDDSEDSSKDDFSIVSNRASVASAKTTCTGCGSNIEVICIYCKRGSIDGETHTNFSVSHITAVDNNLEKQLANQWPLFRPALGEELDAACVANHCPNCGTAQDEHFLHRDPDGPFFGIIGASRPDIRFTRLKGTIQLNGNESIELLD